MLVLQNILIVLSNSALNFDGIKYFLAIHTRNKEENFVLLLEKVGIASNYENMMNDHLMVGSLTQNQSICEREKRSDQMPIKVVLQAKYQI